jgi:predicted secreted protein
MSTYTGNEGIIKIGANAVAEVKTFTLNTHAETVEDTAKGDDWRSYKTTFKSWDGALECHWDDTDATGQLACAEGATVTVDLYFGGEGAPRRHFTGSAIITERTIESPEGDIVPHSITFQGSGALTEENVS